MANILPLSHFRLHDALVKAIDEEIAVRSEPITAATPTSYDEYKFMCGVIRGLVLAQEIAEDVRKRLLGE